MLPGLLEKYLCSLVRYTYFWLVFACILNYLLFFFLSLGYQTILFIFFFTSIFIFSFFCTWPIIPLVIIVMMVFSLVIKIVLVHISGTLKILIFIFSFFCLYILYLGVVCSSIPPSFFPFFALSHDFLFFSYIWIALLFFLNHFSLSIHEVIVSFVTTSTWIFIFFFNRIRYEAVYQLGSTATHYHH